jgi:SAM-dependent methyltransferase
MTDARTLEVYAGRAGEYAARVSVARPRGLDAFVAAIPAGARVLDLGCGPGHTAAALAAAGFRVVAIDATPEMVAMAAAHPGVDARVASFDDLPALGGGFAGVWASFSLLHATRPAFARHLADLHAACRPGATLHLAMKLGQGEGRDRLGRFYTYYTEAELRQALAAAGFRPGAARAGRGAGLSGEDWDWIALTARA